jgi:hypothetical protein
MKIGTLTALFVLCSAGLVFMLARETPEKYAAQFRGESAVQTFFGSMLDIARTKGIPFGVSVVAEVVERGDISTDDCHLLLHLLGHEAHTVYGYDYEAVFKANHGRICLGGYLHGVEAQIATAGLGAKEELWAFCEQMKVRGLTNGPCFHGVGHSAYELTRDIGSSLDFCNAIVGGPESDMSGCWRGVFSEVGFALMGVDSATGQSVPGAEIDGISPDNPLAYCKGLSEWYRDACASQLVKVYVNTAEPEKGLRECLRGADFDAGREACASTLVGVAARIYLERGDVPTIARLIGELPPELVPYGLSGAEEAYVGHAANGRASEWSALCRQLTLDARTTCADMKGGENADGERRSGV